MDIEEQREGRRADWGEFQSRNEEDGCLVEVFDKGGWA